MQAVSRTLYEETTFDQAKVTSVDWRSYPILTFPDAPVLEIDLMGSPRDSRWERRGGSRLCLQAIGNAGVRCGRRAHAPRAADGRACPRCARAGGKLDLHELSVASVAPSGVAGIVRPAKVVPY